MLRRGDTEDDVRALDGLNELGGDVNSHWHDEAGQVAQVLAGLGELRCVRGRVCPEAELMPASPGQRDCQCCSPRPRTDHSYPAHACTPSVLFFLLPNLFSLPCSSLEILA